jgi:muramoyltetrapeptide carboxypeptidase LdcA involved in peptidoglycan recycling
LRPQRFHRDPVGLLAKGSVITFSGPMLAGNFGAETWIRLPSTISGRRCASRNLPSNGRAKGRTAGWKAPCGAAIWRC